MRTALFIMFIILVAPVVNAELFNEGESRNILLGDKGGVLKLVVVSDRQEKVIFSWNNELSKALRSREKHRFSDGSLLVIGNIYVDEAHDNPDMVEMYFTPMASSSSIINTRSQAFDLPGAVDGLFDSLFEEEPQPQPVFQVIQWECDAGIDCNDGNGCTVDSCVGNQCAHTLQQGCPLNNECLSIASAFSIETEQFYCSPEGAWRLKKEEGFSCKERYECKSDLCETNSCTEPPFIETIETPFIETVETPQIQEPKKFSWWKRLLISLGLYQNL